MIWVRLCSALAWIWTLVKKRSDLTPLESGYPIALHVGSTVNMTLALLQTRLRLNNCNTYLEKGRKKNIEGEREIDTLSHRKTNAHTLTLTHSYTHVYTNVHANTHTHTLTYKERITQREITRDRDKKRMR